MAVIARHCRIFRRVLLFITHVEDDASRSCLRNLVRVGIVLITLIAWFVLAQSLDGPAIVGLTLIVAGVVVLNVFSESAIK